MNELSELQDKLYQLTCFVHANDEKIDFLPKNVGLNNVLFSGSIVLFNFTLENCLYAKGFRYIETQKVFDWAEANGFKFSKEKLDNDYRS